ncbi:hypothetical protein EG68_08223 [Paragonimus skrjabini miyazakii]|uniref:Ubiquitin-like domain-containing protein n=1 Tax=Paragonimus skrjabini miyazakii TaxID=59628 RepID=A0A8S9Y9U1_9TREM|nr:hypothetical protein EG68_08223 [Paragonimus skrjabini miyazakii]
MLIHIESGKDGRKDTLDVSTPVTVLDLKERIQRMWNIPVEHQLLVMGGDMALPDDMKLSYEDEFYITNVAKLTISVSWMSSWLYIYHTYKRF